ncbi:MAG TPA: CapA family protein [Acidimicrobiia bacterium]|nr:CapA family protein [Acidimicrobiia bacterium]
MGRGMWGRATAVAGLLALAACSSAGGASPDGTSVHVDPSTTPAWRATTTTTTTKPKARSHRAVASVTLAFAGDVHFEGVLRQELAADPQGLLAPIAPILRRADVAMVNLETAITERGTPQLKIYTFRASPRAFTALSSAGIDVATMANNHGLDFGPVGLMDSLAAIRSSAFPVVGIGANENEAYAPYRTTVRGTRIAIIGASQVIDDPMIATWTATAMQPGIASAKRVDRLVQAVREARATSDTVVVFLHWGQEGSACTTFDQRTLARALVDAGADIVVGSHAHLLLGAGHLARSDGSSAFVDYGLGNFAFYSPPGPSSVTGVLLLTVRKRQVVDYGWQPAHIEAGVPVPVTGSTVTMEQTAWDRLRSCTDLQK